jgi:hypothetical protein
MGPTYRGDRMSFVITQSTAPLASADTPQATAAWMSSGNVVKAAHHHILVPDGRQYGPTKALGRGAKYRSSAITPLTHALSMCGRPVLVRERGPQARPLLAGTRDLP